VNLGPQMMENRSRVWTHPTRQVGWPLHSASNQIPVCHC